MTLKEEFLSMYPDRCQSCARCFVRAALIAASVESGQMAEAAGRAHIAAEAQLVADNCALGEDIILSDPPIVHCNYQVEPES